MDTTGWLLLAGSILVAGGMQGYNIYRIEEFMRRTKGVIRFRPDLENVKEIINLNMRMAVVYIVLYVIFFIVIALMFFGGKMGQAVIIMFFFGIITLPFGLIGKSFEKKVKNLKIESNDPGIAETYQRWLVQWKEARFQLPD